MPRIDWLAIAPEVVVAAALLVVLAVDLFLPRERKYYVAALAVVGTTLAMVPVILMAVSGDTYSMFDGSYVVDSFALVLKGVFLVAAYLVLLVSVSYVESDRFYQGEYYLLLLSSLLGSMVLTSARDLVVLFVALELTTGPLFLLAGWRKGDLRSNEASLKFFIIGVLSTGLMLYGMSLLFGLTGELSFSGIREAIASGGLVDEPVLGLAVLLILVGFGFKVSAVPFHFWAPDTYQGSPPPVTAYLSVSSKLAGFVAMLAVIYLALPAVSGFWGPALWLMAAVSMTVANLSALRQTHLIRLLAYSSVAQAGFMLVPFAGAAIARDGMAEGLGATVIYLVIYAVMNLGAFAVVIAGGRRIGSYEISDWRGLGSYAPRQGVMLAVFFLSLAGLPPLAGWFAKFVMFRAVLISTGPAGVWLAVIAAVNAVVAFYYYARVVKSAWFDPAPDPVPEDAGDRTHRASQPGHGAVAGGGAGGGRLPGDRHVLRRLGRRAGSRRTHRAGRPDRGVRGGRRTVLRTGGTYGDPRRLQFARECRWGLVPGGGGRGRGHHRGPSRPFAVARGPCQRSDRHRCRRIRLRRRHERHSH